MFKEHYEHYGATHSIGTDYDEIPRKGLLEHLAPYFSEFMGTFLLVFTARVLSEPEVGDPVWNPTAIGFMFTVLIYVFGSVNVYGPAAGAHLNPVVSFAAAVALKERWWKAVVYTVLQIAAGLLAGLLCAEVFPRSVSTAVGPQPAFENTYCAGMIEIVYTTVLAFVALNVTYSRRNNPENDQNHFFGLAIGFVVIAGGYAGGNISGGCFNPAMALGLDTTPLKGFRSWTWAYVGFEIFGGFLGACLFLICRREDRLTDEQINQYEPTILVRLVSELLGTFVLVLTMGVCVVMKCDATPWAAAAALMCMTYALKDVSGAHFNPAVTLAVMLGRRGKCPLRRGLAYMLVQFFAGFMASYIIADVHLQGPYSAEQFCLKPTSQVDVSAGVTEEYWAPVFSAEFTFTSMLAFVFLAVATTSSPWPGPWPPAESQTRQHFSFGLAIASCVTAGGFASGSLSGGELNPAVALGLQNSCLLAPGSLQATPYVNFAYFALFELAGGVFAATVFVVTHHREFVKQPSALQ